VQGGRLTVRWLRGAKRPLHARRSKRFGWRYTKVCRAKRSLVGRQRASPRSASQPSLLRHFLNRTDLVALRKARIALRHTQCAMAERAAIS